MANFDKKKYDTEYRKENYKEIRFWFPKAEIDTATAKAKAYGFDTVNAFSKALLEAVLSDELDITGKVGGGRN